MSIAIVDLKDIDKDPERHNLVVFVDEEIPDGGETIFKAELKKINSDGSYTDMNLKRHLRVLKSDGSEKALRELKGIELAVEITLNAANENLQELLTWLQNNIDLKKPNPRVEPVAIIENIGAIQVTRALESGLNLHR